MSTKKSSLFRILLSMLLNRPNAPASSPSTQPPAPPQPPLPADRDAWIAHWEAQGQSWRTEPEIDGERQKYLTERRAITADMKQGIFPFKDIKLGRADIEWLLSTHNGRHEPMELSHENQDKEEGLDVRGADLRFADLHGLPLASLRGGPNRSETIEATWEQRHNAAVLMERVNLSDTHLEGASLSMVNLKGANLKRTHLEGAYLYRVHFEGAYLLETHLEGAYLRNALFDATTSFNNVVLGNKKFGFAALANVNWDAMNLLLVNWAEIKFLGDEVEAYQTRRWDGREKSVDERFGEYRAGVVAYRQLAIALQSQGLNEDAARFAYRAQVLQRKVLWKQRNFWKWLGSAILALLAGYGYRMWRILAAYAIIISVCAAAYFIMGMYHPPHLNLLQAFLESITAFHGRVFYEFFTPDSPQIWITAFEAVTGLVIEGVFIAMLAQRFFGK